MTIDKDALLREARSMILSHVDLNTCYPHERRLISQIDAALSEPQGVVNEENKKLLQELQAAINSCANWEGGGMDYFAELFFRSDLTIRALLAAAKEPQGDGWWWNTRMDDPNFQEDIDQGLRYLEARGLLVRHPEQPHLVSFNEKS